MASIYESQGQQVALTGPSTSGGFQPQQAYDASNIMLRQSEGDLKSFAQFSETLTGFLTNQAKQKNEADYKLGIAEVINGDTAPSEEDKAEFFADRDGLKAQAQIDEQVADQMEQESVPLANQKRVDSPARTGWRGYGNAVGQAKLASQSAYAVLGELMTSDTPIQFTKPDGTVTSIIPSQIKDPATWNVAWRYNLQQYLTRAKVGNINPMILAEELTPTIGQVKSQLFSARMAGAKRELQSEKIEQNKIGLIQSLQELTVKEGGYTTQDLANFWQEHSFNMSIGTGKLRGEANSATVEMMVSYLSSTGQETLLNAFKNTPLLADQPNGVTLGDFFFKEFSAATKEIYANDQAEKARYESEQKDIVANMMATRTSELLSAPISAVGTINEQTKTELRRLWTQTRNKFALEELTKLEQAADNYSPFNDQRILEAIQLDPNSVTPAELEKLWSQQSISAETYKTAKSQLPSTEIENDIKPYQKEISKLVQSMLVSKNKLEGVVISDGSNPFALGVKTGVSEVNSVLRRYLSENPNRKNTNLSDIIQAQVDKMSASDRYTYVAKPDGQVVPKNQFATGGTIIPNYIDLNGRNIKNYTRASDLSKALQTSRALPSQDQILSPEEVKTGQELLASGQQPTGRILSAMKGTGLSLEQLVRAQATANRIPISNIDSTKSAKAARQRFLYAPSASAILANPNSSFQQRIRAWADIGEAQQRARRRLEGKAQSAGVDLAPGARVSMSDYVRLGIQNGLDPEKAVLFAAVGMAESTGQSGVVGKEFPVYGLWQINMAGAMGPDRMSRYGFRSAEELKDPETNARVAVALLKDKGIKDWSAYTDGRYRQYLADAKRAYYDLKASGMNKSSGGNNAIMLGRELLDQGYKIWQHPNFDLNKGFVPSGGSRVARRKYDSAHHYGEALDFPLAGAPNGNNTPEKLDKLAAMLNANKQKYGIRQVLWRTAGHEDHLHVDFNRS
jgi:hypothetical protein